MKLFLTIRVVFTNIKSKKNKIKISGDHGHNILRLFDPLQILFSAQLKKIVIICNKYGV